MATPPGPTYEDYVACVPPANRHKLQQELDCESGDGVDLHLGELAHLLVGWELLAPKLGLSDVDVSDVHSNNKSAELERIDALKRSKSTLGFNATYGAYLNIFVENHKAKGALKCAEKIVMQLGATGPPWLISTHTNGGTPDEQPLNHPYPLSNGNSHLSNSHSPIPQATHVASSGDTPQRAKMTAEEVAEWLAKEGIVKEDIEILKSHNVNERLFLKLDPHSAKLEHVSQTTKDLLEDLQKDMQKFNVHSEDSERAIIEAVDNDAEVSRKLAHGMFVGPTGSGKSSLNDSQREEVVTACTQVTSVRKAAASSPWDAEVTSTFLQIIKYRDRNTGQCKQIKIITELAPIWKKVGSMLGFSNNDILTFESPGSGKPFVNCLMNVFGQWLNNSVNMRNRSSYPATWRGVCNLLQDCDYGGLAEMLRDAVEADFSNIRGNFNECPPSLTSTHTNGGTPEQHPNHPHPLSNGHSPIPQATHVVSNGDTPHIASGDATQRASGDATQRASGDATQRASGDTPHIASGDATQRASGGDATQRAKMTAEEVAEWLMREGIEKEDVEIFKSHKVNERLFLKLNQCSPKLEHVSQTTKDLLEDLQKDMKNI